MQLQLQSQYQYQYQYQSQSNSNSKSQDSLLSALFVYSNKQKQGQTKYWSIRDCCIAPSFALSLNRSMQKSVAFIRPNFPAFKTSNQPPIQTPQERQKFSNLHSLARSQFNEATGFLGGPKVCLCHRSNSRKRLVVV